MQSHIQVIPATMEDSSLIQKLWPFYVYELSRECGKIKGWQCPTDPTFVPDNVMPFFKDANKKAFLIKTHRELAGFALIGKLEVLPDVDMYLNDFFIISKYQNQGIGKRAAYTLFDQYKGKWALGVIPENQKALAFWRHVIDEYSLKGCFSECFKTSEELKTDQHPKPHPMVILRFDIN